MTRDKRHLLDDIMVVGGVGGAILLALGLVLVAPILIGWGTCNLYWAGWAWVRRRTDK